MTVVTRVALLCVVFLCGLEDRAQTQRIRCDRASCLWLHREPRDFAGAQKGCTDPNTQLLALTLREAEMSLPGLMRGSSGSYWLELRSNSTDSPVDEAAAGQHCFAVSMSGPYNVTVSREQCRNKQDGFLCRTTLQGTCSPLQTTADTLVTFTTAHIGLEVIESENHPEGTIAVVEKFQFSAEHPHAKYLCFQGRWLQAPWRCEVLEGGCDPSCNRTTNTCTCPTGKTLHPNSITCTFASEPQGGDSTASTCATGYMLTLDRKRCVDVDECKDGNLCTRAGEECLNMDGGYECTCKDGYDREDGVCVDFSICSKCEHMRCMISNGSYVCACRKSYKVSPLDPTKCLHLCEEESCVAECISEEEKGEKVLNCFCPIGFIKDHRNDMDYCTDIDECESGPCDHKCENSFGSYRCSCKKGFQLHGEGRCVAARDKEEEMGKEEEKSKEEEKGKDEEKEDGDDSPSPPPKHSSSHPVTLPSYIKTGSVLGISMFLALCAVLLCLVVRNMTRRCRSVELPSFKAPDINVFYLQQVTTETYKRLSVDKQFKNDLSRL
ncbi:thrombomodulin-like [Solea solea]|uniref:thrombomodulin-like n=1 Tax=Solea solea TaxID=90069 RepID=UPI00272A15AA|nr:thrombomodulin-like [Solea solea]